MIRDGWCPSCGVPHTRFRWQAPNPMLLSRLCGDCLRDRSRELARLRQAKRRKRLRETH